MDIDQLIELGAQLKAADKTKSYNVHRGDYFAANRKKMMQWLEKAEQNLGKPLPADFHDFYSACIKWVILESEGRGWRGHINEMPVLFDKFRPVHPILNAGNPEVIHSKAKKYAFYGRIWLEEGGQTPYDWEQFNFRARLKELLFVEGSTVQILVDFFDPKKPYQLYYFDGGKPQPLDLDLETFLTYFLYFDTWDPWYFAFLSADDAKENGNIKSLMQTLNENYGGKTIYKQPLAEIAARLKTLQP